MKAVVQRVSHASVKINGKVSGEIEAGLAVLIAFAPYDDNKKMEWMCNKLVNLRVFPDDEGKMNLSAQDIGGGILFISNFTVYGDAKKGFRPSFTGSAPPAEAEPLYEKMLNFLKENYKLNIESGEFGAMMEVNIVNDGPVTIILEK